MLVPKTCTMSLSQRIPWKARSWCMESMRWRLPRQSCPRWQPSMSSQQVMETSPPITIFGSCGSVFPWWVGSVRQIALSIALPMSRLLSVKSRFLGWSVLRLPDPHPLQFLGRFGNGSIRTSFSSKLCALPYHIVLIHHLTACTLPACRFDCIGRRCQRSCSIQSPVGPSFLHYFCREYLFHIMLIEILTTFSHVDLEWW